MSKLNEKRPSVGFGVFIVMLKTFDTNRNATLKGLMVIELRKVLVPTRLIFSNGKVS